MNALLDLRSMELTPMSQEEKTELNGGFIWLAPALVAGLIFSAINNFGDIKKGIVDGFNGTPLSEEVKE